jgi:hypothetical protein
MKNSTRLLGNFLAFFLISGVASAVEMSAQQQQFLSIISDFAQKYDAAPNDMAKGALRPQRAKAICALLKDLTIKDWVGTVSKLSSNNEGKGVLVIGLNEQTRVQTWNNALSDISDKTLIQPGTALHEAAVQLSEGQRVVFSGRLISSKPAAAIDPEVNRLASSPRSALSRRTVSSKQRTASAARWGLLIGLGLSS